MPTHEPYFVLSLAIRHPEIDPVRISTVLQRTPWRSWRAGDARATPRGRKLPGDWPDSYWIESAPVVGERDFFSEIGAELGSLAEHAQFLKEIVATGGTVSLQIDLPGDANIGSVLPHALIVRLAALPLDISVEVFPKMNRD